MSTTANNNTINNANANVNTNANANQEQQEQQVQQAESINNEEGEEIEATNQNQATQETETTTENPKSFEEISGKILKVITPEGNDDRISFIVDKEFDTIDFKTGEVKRTNIFGMNIFAVVNQVSQFIPQIQLADTLALGKMINPQIISLSMVNADFKIRRENHEEGEKRKYGNEVYARNCKTTEFIDVTPNIKPLFAQMLAQLIIPKPAITKEAETKAVLNPFGM